MRLPDVLVRPNETALLAHKLNKTSKFVSNVVYGAKRVNIFSLDIGLQKQVKKTDTGLNQCIQKKAACLVPRLHYSTWAMRFGSPGPRDHPDRGLPVHPT